HLTPGTFRSYFRPPPSVIDRCCAWGSSARESGDPFVDPSPDRLEPRRQRHPRDRHHGHVASHLCGYGLRPKLLRGAVRPSGVCSWSRAGRQFHVARSAGTSEPSLPPGRGLPPPLPRPSPPPPPP